MNGSLNTTYDRFQRKSTPARSRGRLNVAAVSTGRAGLDDERNSQASLRNILTNSTLLGGLFFLIAERGYLFEARRWRGWTLSERLQHIPQDIWAFYNNSMDAHPLLVPAVITGVTYVIADWISQTYEGRFALDFDLKRLIRAAAIGFFLLGPMAHFYYVYQDVFFNWLEGGVKRTWDVPAHIALDQTAYAAVYNVVFYMAVGLGRGDNPVAVTEDIKANFVRLMKAGWKLWPFVHIITYAVIPPQHKVLWVDCVEIVWATILCLVVNEKRDQTVQLVEAMEESPAKEGVYEAIDAFVSGVREMQWEDELAPLCDHDADVFKSENAKVTLLSAVTTEEIARAALDDIIHENEELQEAAQSCVVSAEAMIGDGAAELEFVVAGGGDGRSDVESESVKLEQICAATAVADESLQQLTRKLNVDQLVRVADTLEAVMEEVYEDEMEAANAVAAVKNKALAMTGDEE